MTATATATATALARHERGFGARLWGGIVACFGVVTGVAPDVLHHVGPLAGATHLGFLGVELDQAANETTSGDGEIAATDSQVRVVVVASREDLVIARAVRQTLAAAPAH